MTKRMVFDVTAPDAVEVDRLPGGPAEFISWPRLAMHLCKSGEVITHLEAGPTGLRVHVKAGR